MEEPPVLNLVRLRVIVFLKNWLEHSGADLPQNVMVSIENFIDNQLCTGGHTNLAGQLKKLIQNWKNHVPEAPREQDLNYQVREKAKNIFVLLTL